MRYSHLILLFFGLLFSCDKGIEPIPLGKRLEIVVITEDGELVEGAVVNIFGSQSDFIYQRRRLVDSLVTNKNGTAEFYGITSVAFDAYVSVEKRDANNWGTRVKISISNESTRAVISIKNTIANKIAGRFSKRWRQVKQSVNGTEFRKPCSSFQLIHTFKQDGLINLANAADCSFFGVEEDLNTNISWRVNAQNTGIIIGSIATPSALKIATILELTDTKFRYVYKPAGDLDSPITIEEEFVALN